MSIMSKPRFMHTVSMQDYYENANAAFEKRQPIRYYFDGKNLKGIYQIDSGKNLRKPILKRKFKIGPLDGVDIAEYRELELFHSYHKSISKEQAEKLYPEFFI